MLNFLWAGMLIIGILVGAITGNLGGITNAALNSAGEAVTVAITMLGIMALWTGLMRVAENAGMIVAIANRMRPLLRYLFPGLDAKSKAMEEMQAANPDKTTATKEMCMFMIINMSSLQIVTISVLAYRAQYDSLNPSEIIGPGFLATLISTIAAIAYAKFMEKRVFKNK